MKTILFVDYASVFRSLTTAGGEAAARLATRVPNWITAIQSGRLIGPEGTERTFALKRCYADLRALGQGRAYFDAAGFEVVDCAEANAARGVDLLMAMDSVDLLNAGTDADEFVFLSAEPTLAPLLARLKANGRRTAIYADINTAQAYRALADGVLDAATLAEFLLTRDLPDRQSAAALDRADIEAFARRIHAATSIPLFSPRTFAELFRYLTEEIAQNGYHFQTTAKNVADRLADSGRSVTRRQVVFVVKGLALRGHVFSSGDTPRKLAEVFRDQALYLIANAGLNLADGEDRLLSAWLVDRVPTTIARSQSARATAAEPPPASAPRAARPARRSGTTAARAAAARDITPARLPPPSTASRKPSLISPDDARAAIAAKIAQSVRPRTARPARPATATPSPAAEAAPARTEAIESSILAAIAEAVDVLVEDTEPPAPPPAKKSAAAAPRKRAAATREPAAATREPTRAAPRPRAEPARQESDDIGDEIQRIIATYNRNRKDEPSTPG